MLRTCFRIDPLTIDPRKNGDVISSTLLFMIYEGLTRLLPSGEVELALAKSVSVSADERTYVFHLKNACWSDGEPITAYDFEHSWRKALTPDFSPVSPHLFFPIKNAEAAVIGACPPEEIGLKSIDSKTFQVELERPLPYFLSLISFCNFFPVPYHIESQYPDWKSKPEAHVGNGPFRLVRWEKRKEILLEKNPYYWEAESTSLEGIHIKIVRDGMTTLHLFEEEEIDWICSSVTNFPQEALKEYCQIGKGTIIPVANTKLCYFNTARFPFDNENIRKAFSYAIERQKIVDSVTQLHESPARRCIAPAIQQNKNLNFSLDDEKLAQFYLRKGLFELGFFKNEEESLDVNQFRFRMFLEHLNLSFDNSILHKRIGESLCESWARILGFKIELDSLDFASHIQKLSKGDYSMGLLFLNLQFNDPINFFERFKHKDLIKNFSRFEDPYFSHLLNRSSFLSNSKERMEILEEAEILFLDHMPATPIFHGNIIALNEGNVQNVYATPIGSVHFNKAFLLKREERKIQIEAG